MPFAFENSKFCVCLQTQDKDTGRILCNVISVGFNTQTYVINIRNMQDGIDFKHSLKYSMKIHSVLVGRNKLFSCIITQDSILVLKEDDTFALFSSKSLDFWNTILSVSKIN